MQARFYDEEAFAMWRMLVGGSEGGSLEVSGVEADDTSSKAHWDVGYTFSQTGRQVLNRIHAASDGTRGG